MLVKAPHVKILGTGSFVPDKVVTNFDIEKNVDTTDAWVRDNLGIIERRTVVGDNVFSSDLAYEASINAIDAAGLTNNDIGLVIVATATPDRKAPSTACILHDKLNLTNGSPAFDVSAVCSGFIYALTLGAQSIEMNSCDNVLVVGVDTFSTITDWSRRDCVFFGDGAGAVVLSRSNREGLFNSKIYANGSGKDNFTVYPYDKYFTMNGRAVYETGTQVLPEAIKFVAEESGIKTSDIKHLIPHQPSHRVLRRTAELLELPVERVHMNMQKYANTAGATVPLLLDEVARSGAIKDGDIVAFAAVGSGWTWGSAMYRW